MSEEKNQLLEVWFDMPGEILRGRPCKIIVRIKNRSGAPVVVNKRLSVGYPQSLARELYVIICNPESDENVGIQKRLYDRSFSSPEDYVELLPEEQISTSFNLTDWYDFPKPGEYLVEICYQADEDLAWKPDGLCRGVFCSAKKPVIFESD